MISSSVQHQHHKFRPIRASSASSLCCSASARPWQLREASPDGASRATGASGRESAEEGTEAGTGPAEAPPSDMARPPLGRRLATGTAGDVPDAAVSIS